MMCRRFVFPRSGRRRRWRLPSPILRHQTLKQLIHHRGLRLRGWSRCCRSARNEENFHLILRRLWSGYRHHPQVNHSPIRITHRIHRENRVGSRFTSPPNVRVRMTLPHLAPIDNIPYGRFQRHTVQMSAQLTTIMSSYKSVLDQAEPCRFRDSQAGR